MDNKPLHVLKNRDVRAFENAYLDLCKKYDCYFGRDLVIYELPTLNLFERATVLSKLVRIIKSVNSGVNGV